MYHKALEGHSIHIYPRKASITNLEDLSNEIVFEIFEYLNFNDIYKAFSNLNIRYENLLIDPLFPIKINLSSISKLSFQYYYTQILVPYQHRIQSLRISSAFIIDLLFASKSIELNLIHLEKLVLHNVSKSNYFHDLLDYLPSIPCLTSLVIICKHPVQNKSSIYQQIFRLSQLKYCNISFDGFNKYEILPMAKDEFSPMEIFIINDRCTITEFNVLLSYVPKLRRLSAPYLIDSDDNQIRSYTSTLNHLTHFSLDCDCIHFNQFELMIQNLFPYIQVLHFSTEENKNFFDAHRWEHLITCHMPHLRIFDMKISSYLSFIGQRNDCINKIEQFSSLFWLERNWFFTYSFDDHIFGERIILFSKNSFK
ncbi:hypothetical protein I4U23_015462 [Adineta vaga]|nr:hypothetical protein I4U23_015462 [Adineta vaga]